MKSFSRRTLLLGAGATIGVTSARYLGSSNPSMNGTNTLISTGVENTLNDASLLSSTPIHKHMTMSQRPDTSLVDAIRREIKEAASNSRPVNIGAARHSMGAQSIPHNGHAITYDNDFLEADTSNNTYRAHAGIRWSQVISKLDPLGYSPKVMQSNNDFGLAATFCVNAHGWPVKIGPMGATVQRLKMVLADGELATCSPTQNASLFNLTMGGYGLTGAITELDVEMTPNLRLAPQFKQLPAVEFGTAFVNTLSDPSVKMAYGRLNIGRDNFFEEALLIAYRPTVDQNDLPAASGSGVMSKLARHIYRAQLGNERMKDLRWWTETDLGRVMPESW